MTRYNEQAAKTFSNDLFEVTAVVKDEQILFDAEQVAISLGITQSKNGKEYVRWERVNDYLPNSPVVGKGTLLPESLIYKLAFKANNEVAEKFQDWLAIEVLPSIRKNGSYARPKSAREEMLLLMQVNEETAQRVDAIETDVQQLKETTRIDTYQEKQLADIVKNQVLKAVGGKKANAYSMAGRIFPDAWRTLKNHFGIPSYKALPKVKFDEAVELLELWKPSASLQLEINALNRQIIMEV